MRVLQYIKKRYEGFIGLPIEQLSNELLADDRPPRTEVTSGAEYKKFVSFEWVANRVEKLNS